MRSGLFNRDIFSRDTQPKETKEQGQDQDVNDKCDNIMSRCTLKTIEEEEVSQRSLSSVGDDDIVEEADIDDVLEQPLPPHQATACDHCSC